MRHTVALHGVIVGYSDLEHVNIVLRRAWGKLRPAPGYELVRPIFQLFSEAIPIRGGETRDAEKLARYHAARARMGLTLADAHDTVIPTSVIHISDYPGALELDVLINDDEYWHSRSSQA